MRLVLWEETPVFLEMDNATRHAYASQVGPCARVQPTVPYHAKRLPLAAPAPLPPQGPSPDGHPIPLKRLSQTLVYNHGLLALWHEHAVAALLDVDEYLLTPHKGATLEQAG